MILFDLKCTAGHVFEAWFNNSGAYEEQREAAVIACPICGVTAVEKAPMAPRLGSRALSSPDPGRQEVSGATEGRGSAVAMPGEKALRVAFREAMERVRSHVEANFDYVGKSFAEEARKIHYGEIDARPIYGEATKEQSTALRDEGVDFVSLPVPPKPDA